MKCYSFWILILEQNVFRIIYSTIEEESRTLNRTFGTLKNIILQKYMGESSIIVLENFQFLGNFPGNIWGKYSPTYLGGKFPQIFWGKFTNYGVICVTNILGKFPKNLFTVNIIKLTWVSVSNKKK